MSSLYFDLGNTKAKWMLGDQMGVVEYKGFVSYLASNSWGPFGQVVIASVLGHQHAPIVAAIRNSLSVSVKQCLVTEVALGVRCAYRDPAKLGVDRWLAILASWQRYKCACLVVDLGTAATLDVLDASGRHLGGYIVSGLSLALKGLLQGTQNIKPDPSHYSLAALEPGKNTAEAVYNGALYSLVSLIESSYQNLLKTDTQAKLILAGGDASIVGSHLQSQYELIDGLVFEGMQLLESENLVVDA